MPLYEGEFTFKTEEWGSVTLEADDDAQADEFIREHVREAYPDAMMIEVDSIKQLAGHA